MIKGTAKRSLIALAAAVFVAQGALAQDMKFFRASGGHPFRIGLPVDLTVSVPHRIATDGREVQLDLEGRGRVVRLERSGSRGYYGEDGVDITGVAIEFASPLRFNTDWI